MARGSVQPVRKNYPNARALCLVSWRLEVLRRRAPCSFFYESYVHTPIPACTVLQLALVGHLELDWQMSAQRLGDFEPGVSSAHSGVAVVPVGTSFGHGLNSPQAGLQKLPLTPWIWTASSPDWHVPEVPGSS